MKALSVWQPWATLIATGEKEYETRHWVPRGWLQRGELLAIHASKRWQHDQWSLCGMSPFREALLRHGIQFPDQQLPRGAMLGVVRFVDIFHVEDIVGKLSSQERAFGNYAPKRFAWQFEVVQVFEEPVAAIGQQGVFHWTPTAGLDLPDDGLWRLL